jgi:hypothetical protein
MNKKKTILRFLFVFILIILVCIFALFVFYKKSINISSLLEYKNDKYGFTFALPKNWNDYRILINKWEGFDIEKVNHNIPSDIGPIILIRNPKWTEKNPYQDIPIMIFTLDQWQKVKQEKLSVSAAPIQPTELGNNSKYVFALPARYNYSFLSGWEEVEQILKTNPLKTFNP